MDDAARLDCYIDAHGAAAIAAIAAIVNLLAGYPFDIVAEPSSSGSSMFGQLLSHAAASYHLPLTIGFSVADQGNFVWGGAILLRAAALQQQEQGPASILQVRHATSQHVMRTQTVTAVLVQVCFYSSAVCCMLAASVMPPPPSPLLRLQGLLTSCFHATMCVGRLQAGCWHCHKIIKPCRGCGPHSLACCSPPIPQQLSVTALSVFLPFSPSKGGGLFPLKYTR